MPVLRRLLAVAAMLSASCIPAGRREYQPLSSWERDAMAKADRHVFPEDVRGRFAALRGQEVAWAGVVKHAEVTRLRDRVRITLDLDHHYYDWIETYSPESAPIWLSPLGEGKFRVIWDVMPNTTDDALDSITTEDNLVLVYGTPKTMDGQRVVLKGVFCRGIEHRYYDTHATEYDRSAVH